MKFLREWLADNLRMERACAAARAVIYADDSLRSSARRRGDPVFLKFACRQRLEPDDRASLDPLVQHQARSRGHEGEGCEEVDGRRPAGRGRGARAQVFVHDHVTRLRSPRSVPSVGKPAFA